MESMVAVQALRARKERNHMDKLKRKEFEVMRPKSVQGVRCAVQAPVDLDKSNLCMASCCSTDRNLVFCAPACTQRFAGEPLVGAVRKIPCAARSQGAGSLRLVSNQGTTCTR